MSEDIELLHRYAQEGSQEAFAAIVRRHLGLVYHTALRQVGGDAHLAEEAAQDVFIDMGRKAAMLTKRPVLAGWLYVSSCYAAANLVRSARRRKAWEMEASIMQELSAPNTEAEWDRVRPDLDELMLRLNERDREALLLRYFEGLRLSDIAQKLQLTEDGARLRVNRALEKLRRLFARRGIASTGGALAAALASHAGAAPPASLAGTLAAAALSELGVSSGLTSTGLGLWKFMTISKPTMIGLGVLVLLGAAAVYELKHSIYPRSVSNANFGVGAANHPGSAQSSTAMNARHERSASVAREPRNGATSTKAAHSATTPADRKAEVLADLDRGVVPIAALANVGHLTPRAAMESFVWAIARGTNDDIATTLALSAPEKAKLDAVLATLPDATRAEYPDAEHLMAVSAAFEGTLVPPSGYLQIVSESANAVDSTSIDFHMQADPPTYAHLDPNNTNNCLLQNGPDGWKVVVPDYAVNKLVQSITETGKVGH